MNSINAYFNGTACIPLEAFDFKMNQKLIITALDDFVVPPETMPPDSKENFLARLKDSKKSENSITYATNKKNKIFDLAGKIEFDEAFILETREISKI